MGQDLAQVPYTPSKHFLMGGLRLLVNEPSSGLNNKGWRYFGKVKEPSFNPLNEFFEHFAADSGGNEKDFEAPSRTGYNLGFTAEEFLAENLARFFFAGDPADVAADAVATSPAELVVAGKTGARHGLLNGRQTQDQIDDLVVYNDTDTAALVLDTDYEIVQQFGLTFIVMLVDTHAGDVLSIGEGATGSNAYHYTKLAHKLIAPMTTLTLEVAAILQIPAKQGPNLEWWIPRCTIRPDGEFALTAEENSSLKFLLSLLSDAANNPNYPFGKLFYYGRDDAGASLI